MGWIFSDARRDERPDPRPAPKLPAWIPFEDPADAHPAAAAALMNYATSCLLIKVWVGDEQCAGAGVWEWIVIRPNTGRRICVAVVAAGIEDDGLAFLASADQAV